MTPTKPAAEKTALPAEKTGEQVTEVEKVEAAESTVETPAEPSTTHDASWWEARAKAIEKENVKAQKRLETFEKQEQDRENAAKSELQKAQDRADKAEKEAKDVKLDLLRRDVAEKVKLPSAFASRIQGDTVEDMTEDAKALLAAMPVPVPPKLPPTNPGAPQTGETRAERKARLGI